jgi:hypothetical protein
VADAPQLNPALAPTLDEALLGSMLRAEPGIPELPAIHRSPREAIEDELRPALAAGQAYVLFSGGLDSSLMLAIGTALARREGFAPPIPITHRYADDPGSGEDDWQELVIGHVGAADWLRVDATGRHDLFGAAGLAVLARHGPQLPPYWWIARLPPEAGGQPIEAPPASDVHAALITGNGGDEAFPPTPWPLVDRVLGGDPRPLRHLRGLRRELQPRLARERLVEDVLADECPWVRPEHRAAVVSRRAHDIVGVSRRYDRYLDVLWRSRLTQSAVDRVAVGARESGARLVVPMQSPGVLSALAARYGCRFPASRSDAYREIAHGLLPEQLLARTTKAVASSAFLGPATTAWLRGWDGSGPDGQYVDGLVVRDALLALAEGREGGDARATVLAARARHALLS